MPPDTEHYYFSFYSINNILVSSGFERRSPPEELERRTSYRHTAERNTELHGPPTMQS
jgi:hypothetical protein